MAPPAKSEPAAGENIRRKHQRKSVRQRIRDVGRHGSTYEIDEGANPILATRRDFITGLKGAEGAYRDPATGDFFFSTWGQEIWFQASFPRVAFASMSFPIVNTPFTHTFGATVGLHFLSNRGI